MRRLLAPLSLTLAVSIAGCVSAPPPPPAPVAPTPTPAPPPPPPAPALGPDWRDWPITPGDWVYRQDARGSIALFGRANADADFVIRCDKLQKRIFLSRAGEGGQGSMTIRTTSIARTLSAAPTGATPPYTAVSLGVQDPILDAMGYSRGRFLVIAGGMPTLVIPAWAEVLRVTEDCR